jgi:exodeoxyribonuclease VII small subunit
MNQQGDDPTSEPGYAEALAELEAILDELEDGEVDVDRLADRVRRAAALVELCRGRVDEARVEVTRIVAELDGDPSMPAPTTESESRPAGRGVERGG